VVLALVAGVELCIGNCWAVCCIDVAGFGVGFVRGVLVAFASQWGKGGNWL